MMAFSDLTRLMGQFRDVQQNLQRLQEQAAQIVAEASSGGGMVTARVNGRNELVELKIDPQAVKTADVEMLEDLVRAAVNAAAAQSQEQMKAEMARLTGGLNLPGLDQLGSLLA